MHPLPAPLRETSTDIACTTASSSLVPGDDSSTAIDMSCSYRNFTSTRGADQAFHDAAKTFLARIEGDRLREHAEIALHLLLEIHGDTSEITRELAEFNRKSPGSIGSKIASGLDAAWRSSGELVNQDGVTAALNVAGDRLGGVTKAAAYPSGLIMGGVGLGIEGSELHESLREDGIRSFKTVESAAGVGSLAALSTQKLMHITNFVDDSENLENTVIPSAKSLSAVKKANAALNGQYAGQIAQDSYVAAAGHGLQMLKRAVGMVGAGIDIASAGLTKQITNDDPEISKEFKTQVKNGLTKAQVRSGIKGALDAASLAAAGARLDGQVASGTGTVAEAADYAIDNTDGADAIRQAADGITTNGEIPVIPVAVVHGLRNAYRPGNSSGKMSYVFAPKPVSKSEKNPALDIHQMNELFDKVSDLRSDMMALPDRGKEVGVLIKLLTRAKADILPAMYKDRAATATKLRHRAIDDARHLYGRATDLLGISGEPDIEEGGRPEPSSRDAMFEQSVSTENETTRF